MKAIFIMLFFMFYLLAVGMLAVVGIVSLKVLERADELLDAKRRDRADKLMKELRKVTRKNQ